MRQYKAKTVRDGEWVYGYLYHDQVMGPRGVGEDVMIIRNDLDEDFIVRPETVCQGSGTVDKHDDEIYELDIIMSPHGTTYAVKFHNGMFEPVAYYATGLFEIVGNLIDNRGDYLG